MGEPLRERAKLARNGILQPAKPTAGAKLGRLNGKQKSSNHRQEAEEGRKLVWNICVTKSAPKTRPKRSGRQSRLSQLGDDASYLLFAGQQFKSTERRGRNELNHLALAFLVGSLLPRDEVIPFLALFSCFVCLRFMLNILLML